MRAIDHSYYRARRSFSLFEKNQNLMTSGSTRFKRKKGKEMVGAMLSRPGAVCTRYTRIDLDPAHRSFIGAR